LGKSAVSLSTHGISCGCTYYTLLRVVNAKRPDVLKHVGASVDRAQNSQAAPILNIFVPQTGHLPSVAGRPFFIVI